MTTPTGTITLADVQTEFGGANPIGLNEYYAGAGYVPVGTAGVPSSGAISMDNLRGKSGVFYGTLTPSLSSIAEGGATVTFTWSGGTGLANGTYYWRLAGTNIDTNDFNSLTGSFSVTSNTGSFGVSAKVESAFEGTESFQALVGAASGVPIVLVASAFVSIVESGTYAVSNTTSVSEGSSITFTVTTTNLPNSTLYYSLDAVSGTFNSADMSAGTLTGSLTTTSGSGSVTLTIAADSLTEGTESFKFNLRTGSTVGTIVAFGPTVSISDTSLSPPTYNSLTWSPSTINEGQTATWTLSTSNVPNGTALYATMTHGTAATSDVFPNVTQQLIYTTGNSTSGTVTAAYDTTFESQETYIMYVRTGSYTGTVVRQATLNINQALGTIPGLTLSYTGGVQNGPTVLYLQITSIEAYPVARDFAISYVVNGQAETAAGLTRTTIRVEANATSSVNYDVFNRNPANLFSVIVFYARWANAYNGKQSNQLTNIWI